jgi:hypothetical protein
MSKKKKEIKIPLKEKVVLEDLIKASVKKPKK